MSEFDDFWNENYGEHSGQSKGSYAKVYVAFEAGKEARQSEINDLTFKLNGAQFTLNCMARNVQEYKTEIDEAKRKSEKLERKLRWSEALRNNQFEHLLEVTEEKAKLRLENERLKTEAMEVGSLKKSIVDALEAFNDGAFNYCQSELEKALRGES